MGFRTAVVLFALIAAIPAQAATTERVDLPVRGQTIALTIYKPDVAPSQIKGTILMGSGDVGWVGLAVSLANWLSGDGYIVVGINVREYLSVFTTRKGGHLETRHVAGDYSTIASYLKGRGLLVAPVIASGVSEGAGMAVLAAAGPDRGWIKGVITLGLPPTAELAWRWSDFTSWITKKDSGEPVFAPKDFIGQISPLPVCMIQSTKDEYVTEREYRELEAAARQPKRLVLIDASNHRFTDKLDDLRREYERALAWIGK